MLIDELLKFGRFVLKIFRILILKFVILLIEPGIC